MSIFSNPFASKSKPVSISNTEINTAVQKMYDAINYPVIDFNSELGRKIASLTICAKILAQDIGRLSINIYKTDENGSKVKLFDDYRHRLLHHAPNNYTDSFTFWSSTEFTRDFDGNSYVKINKDFNGFVKSFERIEYESVIGTKKSDDKLLYTVKNDDGSTVDYNSQEILHFRNLSSDGLYGRDPKSDLAINLGLSYKALVTLDNIYNNGARPTLYIESVVPDGLDPIEWVKSQDAFNTKYGGYNKTGQTMFGAPFTKATVLDINVADAQFIESIKYNNGQVAAYFGIPQHKIGNIESSKFNSLMEMQMDYIKNTIAPIIAMYRRELQFKLLTEEELNNGYSIEFDTTALEVTDNKTRIENYKSLFGMAAISPNDICNNENMESYDGGDSHYIATGYMSMNKANGTITPSVTDNLKM